MAPGTCGIDSTVVAAVVGELDRKRRASSIGATAESEGLGSSSVMFCLSSRFRELGRAELVDGDRGMVSYMYLESGYR